jgi:hypothetical protein
LPGRACRRRTSSKKHSSTYIDGTYRAKVTLTEGQAQKLGVKRRTLISTGNRTIRDGGNTLSLRLGKGTKAGLHAARIKPTLTISLSDGSTLRTHLAI